MKLILAILVTVCLQQGYAAYGQTITISKKNASISSVLKEIRAQTGYDFFFEDSSIDGAKKIDIRIINGSIEEVLASCFKGESISYTISGNAIVIRQRMNAYRGTPESFQQKQVRGNVVDEHGAPLESVTVAVKGTSVVAVTDAQGNYLLTVPESGQMLVFSIIGFIPVEVEIGDRAEINVSLTAQATGLDEVVVVGYGTQRQEHLTGAVEVVDMTGIDSRPLSNAGLALQGKIGGAFISQNSGQPGADNAKILIRGIGTFNNTNPLIIVDGMEASINDVNPKDIATITVLKDASSSAIYGNRAANGVILITTKQGEIKTTNVEYTGYWALQNVTDMPEVLEGLEYLELRAQAYNNTNKRYPTWYTDEYMDNFRNNVDPVLYPTDVSWRDFLLHPANMHDHYVSITGGSQTLRYATSVGYLDQDGIAVGNNSKKLTFRSNLSSYFLNERLNINLLVSGHHRHMQDLVDGMGNAFYNAYVAPPTIRMIIPGVGYSPYGYNYGAKEEGGFNNTTVAPINLQGQLKFEVLKGLDINATYGIYRETYENKVFRPTVQLFALNSDGSLRLPTPRRSELTSNSSTVQTTLFNSYASYSRQIANHDLSLMVGMEARTHETQSYSMRGSDLSVNLPQYNFADPVTRDNGSSASALSWLSQFARLNYNYAGKYLLEFAARHDGSSRFMEKWGFFPSFSAGWRISEEPFMRDQGWLSDLKFRASWGRLGNESIGQAYAASDELSLNLFYNFNNALTQAAAVTKLANRSTSWESSEMINWGIDFSVLNNKLSGNIDYFTKNTFDILMQIPISSTLGLATIPYQNVGKMRNNGVEIALKYRGQIGNVSLSTNVMASHVKNKIVDLAGRSPILLGSFIWEEGKPYDSFYGYQHEGIYQSQEEIDNHLLIYNNDGSTRNPYVGLVPEPGDIRFKDNITVDRDGDGIPESRDGVINEDDRQIIGKSFPDWTFSGGIDLSWQNFDLSLFFQGVKGINSLNQGMVTAPFHGGEANTGEWYRNAWTEERPSKTIQRVYSDPSRFDIVSSYYLEDASYIRLKNVQLGYQLADGILRGVGLNPNSTRLRLYANVQNALTWTAMRFGFDPEKPSSSLNTLQYPQVRIYSVGMNVKF